MLNQGGGDMKQFKLMFNVHIQCLVTLCAKTTYYPRYYQYALRTIKIDKKFYLVSFFFIASVHTPVCLYYLSGCLGLL